MSRWLGVLGVACIVLGVVALIYGGFWYEKEEAKAQLGPVSIEVEKRERVNIPVWAGVLVTGLGAGLLLWRRRA